MVMISNIFKKGIEKFVGIFGGSYKNIDTTYKIFDKDNNLIAYVDVIERVRTIRDAYPLCVPAKRLVKLMDKRLNPTIIWVCDDGIIYGRIEKLRGDISYDGRDIIVYFDKQKPFKYVRF
jgi:hypothetical protein